MKIMFQAIGNRFFRKKLLFFVLLTISILSTFLYSVRYSLPRLDFMKFLYIIGDFTDIVDEPKFCRIPIFNPFDPTILKYIKPPPMLNCPKVQADLTFVDYDGVLRYNETEMFQLQNNHRITDFVCFYKLFDRGSWDDDSLKYDEPIRFVKPVKISKDMVEVSCTAKNSSGNSIENFYWNVHVHPSPKPDKQFAGPTEDQLSVLIIQIDSMSVSALKRNMPLTYEYVKTKMNMFLFDGFNKMGENTQPNMIGALTGKRLYTEQKGMPGEIEWLFGLRVRSDNLPLISKEFAAKAYVTTFNEDRPDISFFNYYEFKGFSRKPTDFYYRSFWLAVQNRVPYSSNTTYCFQNLPFGDIFVDITKRQLVSWKDYLQFILTSFNYYSHEGDGTPISYADGAYAKFWREMVDGGYLNKTLVIFMSDHGHRFAPIRETFVGLMEELNPFLGLWLPDWFYDRHPYIKNSLSLNRHRLTSAFDIHETLLDVLHKNYNGSQRPASSRGMSLLYDLPEDRTCSQAGIPRQYCLCIKYSSVDVNSDYLPSAAEALEHQLNKLLAHYNECHTIKHRSIIRAEKLIISNESQVQNSSKTLPDEIRLVVETEPNQAVFEALLKLNSDKVWIVESHIQRLNAYTNSADCMKDRVLKKYCTCK